MTIIFDTGEFWIESHQVTGVAVAAGGGTFDTDITLDRAGHIISAMTQTSRMGNTAHVISRLITITGQQLTYGLTISQVRQQFLNFDAAIAETDAGCIITLFMRR